MMNPGSCYKCKCELWIPEALYEAAQRGRGRVEFFCSYGHAQVFSEGESEETKLRRERDILKQANARLEEEATEAIRRAEQAEKTAKGARTMAKNLRRRAAAGTCPCCQRSFSNMAAHMTKQHPNFVAENVVPLKRA